MLERSTEVLLSYSFSHAFEFLGGMLNNLGLSSVKMCTILPYFAGEQGCSQKQPRFRFDFGHRYFARCLAASYPSLCIRKPSLQTGTPSSSIVNTDTRGMAERETAEDGIKRSFLKHAAPDSDRSNFQFQSKQIGAQHAGRRPLFRAKNRVAFLHDRIRFGKIEIPELHDIIPGAFEKQVLKDP